MSEEELSNEEQEWNNKEEYEEFIKEQDKEFKDNKKDIWDGVSKIEHSIEAYMMTLDEEIEYIRDNIWDKKGEENGDSINATENSDRDVNNIDWTVERSSFIDNIEECIEKVELMIRNLRHDVKNILIKNKKD